MTDCYSPHPQEFYTLGIKKPKSMKNVSLGLGDSTIIKSTTLWNFLVVVSKLPFVWERRGIKKGACPASFPQLTEAGADLERHLRGVKIKTLIKTHDIYGFCDIMIKEDLNHLSLCKFFGSENALKMVVKARCYSFKKSRRLRLTRREQAVIKMVKRQI